MLRKDVRIEVPIECGPELDEVMGHILGRPYEAFAKSDYGTLELFMSTCPSSTLFRIVGQLEEFAVPFLVSYSAKSMGIVRIHYDVKGMDSKALTTDLTGDYTGDEEK